MRDCGPDRTGRIVVDPVTGRGRSLMDRRQRVREEFIEARRKELTRPRCANCVYSMRPTGHWFRLILAHWPGLLACFNHPDDPGRMMEVCYLDVCRNFRGKQRPAIRLDAPEPPAPGVRCIPLTKGKHALVDAEDFEKLAEHKWMALFSCGNWYAWRSAKGKCILMHREIMNASKDRIVDHKDGNGLNNCKANLRLCNYGQNNANRKPCGKSSQYKCVSWDKQRKKWKATTIRNGNTTVIGRYDDERQAARVADYGNIELHGEFAYLNFPNEWTKERRQQVHEKAQATRGRR